MVAKRKLSSPGTGVLDEDKQSERAGGIFLPTIIAKDDGKFERFDRVVAEGGYRTKVVDTTLGEVGRRESAPGDGRSP